MGDRENLEAQQRTQDEIRRQNQPEVRPHDREGYNVAPPVAPADPSEAPDDATEEDNEYRESPLSYQGRGPQAVDGDKVEFTRQLFSHQLNFVNGRLLLEADAKSHGGASHTYRVSTLTPENETDDSVADFEYLLAFQEGPIKEAGVNGITNEVLLAVLIDRLEGFQEGAFACPENGEALDHVRKALEALNRRTQARLERGVEGTHNV